MHKVSVVIELRSVCSAPDVKECKSAAGSGVLQISSFTAVVFHIHVHGAKFSEAGADPRSLYWCEYTFVYLLGKPLFELNSSVLVSVYLSMLSVQCWKLPCSSFKCNLFQTGALELLSLNFSLQLNRTPTVLSPLGHCGNKNHNHSNKKQKMCNCEEVWSSTSSVYCGAFAGHPGNPSGREAVAWSCNYG